MKTKQKIIESFSLEGTLGTYLFQPPAQSRDSYEVRPDFLAFCPLGS